MTAPDFASTSSFLLRVGDLFVTHELHGGPKKLVRRPDGTLRTGEHRSSGPGRFLTAVDVFEALESVRTRNGVYFHATLKAGPDAGATVRLHSNHVWPFAPYTRAETSEAIAEAERQGAAVRSFLESGEPAVAASSAHAQRPPARAATSTAPTKRNTTVSLRADVLEEAKAHGINISATLEARLVELIREARADAWRRENRDSIEQYNLKVEEQGIFAAKHRLF